MQEICKKSVESARTEALVVCKKYKAGIKFCVIIMGIIMLIVLFAMEFTVALIVDVMLLIIGFFQFYLFQADITHLIKVSRRWNLLYARLRELDSKEWESALCQ